MKRGLLGLAAAAGLMSCGQRYDPAPARLEGGAEWRVVGPGGGGAFLYPAVSPHDARLLAASTDMTGCFVSEDGGLTWRASLLRFTCRFAFDARDAQVLYAAAGPAGLYRSADRGRTWALVLPKPESVRRLAYEGDEAAPVLLDGVGRAQPWVYGVATSAGRVWAVWGTSLLVSGDGGRVWNKVVELPETVWRLWPDGQGRTIYLQTAQGVAVWDGQRLATPAGPVPGKTVTEVSVSWTDAAARPTVWAVQEDTPGGVWRSGDGGQSWQPAAPYADGRFRAVAAASERVYLSYTRGGEAGVVGSRDGGRTWSALWTDRGAQAAANMNDPWLNQARGPDYGEHPRTLQASADGRLVLGGDLGRVVQSTDGGANWTGIYARRFADGSAATNGLDVLTSYGVHQDPFEPRRVFVSYTDIGLMMSDNGGASWRPSQAGMPRAWSNTSYWVVFDAAARGRMWSAQSATHDLPRARMFRRRPLNQLGRGGVVMSLDGGRTWRSSSNGLPEAPVVHLLLDPDSPAAARRLWAVLPGHGVWRSEDGAGKWSADNDGLDLERYPLAWRLHVDAIGTQYLVVYGCEERKGRPGGAGALYRRTKGVARWTMVTLPAGVTAPTDIASDAGNALRLWLTSWDAGLWRSEDGGAAWQRVLDGGHLASVTVDGRRPGRVYAAGYENAIWRSDDGGDHWRRLPGFDFLRAQRVTPDAGDAERIWVTTFGASVWTGPAAGAARINGRAAFDPLAAWVEAARPKAAK